MVVTEEYIKELVKDQVTKQLAPIKESIKKLNIQLENLATEIAILKEGDNI